MAAIALFKLLKGGLLLALGLGLLKLVHVEVATVFSLLIEALHLDADSRFIHGMVLRVDALQPHSLQVAALVSLAYAALLTVEGVGLWLEFGWAAYLTVLSTSLLVPVELYELVERPSVVRVAVLFVNVGIVFYLIGQLRAHTLREGKAHTNRV
ncbi:MAG: DUF2127 domain-containing protein [Nitrospiraceae bacterium]|nr:DUF2127 domain-containing protein [Nitrospiraceae bacterium]